VDDEVVAAVAVLLLAEPWVAVDGAAMGWSLKASREARAVGTSRVAALARSPPSVRPWPRGFASDATQPGTAVATPHVDLTLVDESGHDGTADGCGPHTP